MNCIAGTVKAVSSFYETEPWGMLGANNFLNIAVKLITHHDAITFLNIVLSIEEQLGRKHNHLSLKYESRPIDIDILFYGSSVIQTSRLTVPHPRLHERKFVLTPLCEIASDFTHPVFQKTIETLSLECQDQLETTILKAYIS